MNQHLLIETLNTHLQEVGLPYTASYKEKHKNQLLCDTLLLTPISKNQNALPITIRLPHPEMLSFSTIWSILLLAIENHPSTDLLQISQAFDPEKDLISLRLLPKEKEPELFATHAIYESFFDLLLVPYRSLPGNLPFQTPVTSDWLIDAHTSAAQIFTLAKKQLFSDFSLIAINDDEEYPLYYLTNHRHHYGASIIISEEVLRLLFTIHGCFYLFPCTVHEWLFFPAGELTLPEARNLLLSTAHSAFSAGAFTQQGFYFRGEQLLPLLS